MVSRSSLGIFGGMAIFFVGLIAVGMQADLVESTAMGSSKTGSSGAYNASKGVFEIAGGAGGSGMALAGGAVFLLICAGVLLTIYGGGR